MIYRVYVIHEMLIRAESWEEAKEKAMDGDYIMYDEYLDKERNREQENAE